MITATELINNDIPTLTPSDTGDLALKWMDEFKVFQLPVLNGNQLVGVVHERDILESVNPEEAISNQGIQMLRPFVSQHEHIYEIIKTISSLKLAVLPVLNEQQEYLGCISLRTLLQKTAEMASMSEPGGLIVLRMPIQDYNLSQIAQIIESNDAKVLSCYITSTADSNQTEVTVKINLEDLAPILQTFSRYDYTVVATYHHSDYEEDLKKRLQSFMNYLNM